MPIYQAENYLKRSLDSILNQSFKDFELILVDDGSIDNSGRICEEYARKDKRIRVVHKINGGVSSARQLGLELSKGEYIIFADPDDWLEKNMFEIMYTVAKDNFADMVICDFYAEYPGKSIYMKQKPSDLKPQTILEELFPYLNGCTWNKLVRRNCFDKYNVKFPENVCFCEDLYVNCKLLREEISVSYVDKALYHYDQIVNPNSLVRFYDSNTYEHDIRLWNLFLELFNDRKEPDRMRQILARNMTERAFLGNIYTSKDFKRKFNRFSGLLKLEAKDIKGILYWLSSIGYYHLCHDVYISIKFLKNIFKSRKCQR